MTILDALDTPIASATQRRAIEAGSEPVLVLAGPGAGKTFCLIERIGFLVEKLQFDPARICAFTFTNKAAGEIATRLERRLGPRAGLVKSGTIHAFCAELLRELGETVGLQRGFGIVDEEFQLSLLRRLEGYRRWHRQVLGRFSTHRFLGEPLRQNDAELFSRYRSLLESKNLVDFDMLVLKTDELLRNDAAGATVRARWDCVLVDEFQDLNRIQYAIIRELVRDHRNLFAVGDDEQSIYSWAGADPELFLTLMNDFGKKGVIELGENRRCPRQVVVLARRLAAINTPLFEHRRHAEPDRDSPYPVTALTFATEKAEIAWIIEDLRRDREECQHAWGDVALLYRKHEIGDLAEAAFLAAGIPCRLVQGRALADDPAVGYVIAALRLIQSPDDPFHQEGFLQVVLPPAVFDEARATAEATDQNVLSQLQRMARELPWRHADARKIRRGFAVLQNLAALGARHTTLASLVQDILSERVGPFRSVLEDVHDVLSDPAENEEVQRLSHRLAEALATGRPIWIPRLGGIEIPLRELLLGAGLPRVLLGGDRPANATALGPADAPSLGLSLTVFKAAQLLVSRDFGNRFRDFTAVDLESTDRDIARAEIVEIAAVRVRDGEIVEEFRSLVKPRVPITEGARAVHGIGEDDVADAPFFEELWPAFQEFFGGDLLVAHYGYHFDFPLLRRMTDALSRAHFRTYDTLPLARQLHAGSAKLVDLARHYGVDPGQSHRAHDDARTLAHVFLALGEAKVARARKTVLANLLDYLGVALALGDEEPTESEAQLLRRLSTPYALGRYSTCLDRYRLERDQAGDESIPTVDEVIERLGGEQRMLRIRADRSADERYPGAMRRLRVLLDQSAGQPLAEQIAAFLDRAVLSRWDGAEPEPARVNLLTLHSTKGLEFSRVYIVGAEDAQLPGGRDPSKREIEEARRLLYVGMTRTKDRLVLTRVDARSGKDTGGHRFLDEMALLPRSP